MDEKTHALALTIGAFVRSQRERRGLSQAEVAHRIGRDPSFVSLIEAGKRDVALDTLTQIARALDCTIRVRLEAAERSTEITVHV